MIKQIYLVRGRRDEQIPGFSQRIHELASAVASSEKPKKLTYTITDITPPSFSVIPFKKELVAVLSIYLDHSNKMDSITNSDGFSGAYKVEEALPVAYDKNWENGQPTPGICLLTLFRKKSGIDRKTFLDRWHNGHTPLTLKVHPVWHYNRNVVLDKLEDNSEGHDGIVEEHFLRRSQLLNPAIFFGNPLTMVPNMIRVYADVKSFLEYKSTEPYLTREYHIV